MKALACAGLALPLMVTSCHVRTAAARVATVGTFRDSLRTCFDGATIRRWDHFSLYHGGRFTGRDPSSRLTQTARVRFAGSTAARRLPVVGTVTAATVLVDLVTPNRAFSANDLRDIVIYDAVRDDGGDRFAFDVAQAVRTEPLVRLGSTASGPGPFTDRIPASNLPRACPPVDFGAAA